MRKRLALAGLLAILGIGDNLQAQEKTNSCKIVQEVSDKYVLLTKKFEKTLDMAQTNKSAFRFIYKDPVRVIGNYTDTDKSYLNGFDGNGIYCHFIPNPTRLSFEDGTNHIILSGDAYGKWQETRGIIRIEGDKEKIEFECPREILKERAEKLLEKFKLLSMPELPDALY